MAQTRTTSMTKTRDRPAQPSWLTNMRAAMAERAQGSPRRRNASKSTNSNAKIKTVLAVAAGGAAGGLASALMVKGGIPPKNALPVVAIGGAVGAVTLTGNARIASMGAAGLATGQFVIGLIASHVGSTGGGAAKPAAGGATVAAPPRQAAGGGMDLDAAFRNARQQMDDSE